MYQQYGILMRVKAVKITTLFLGATIGISNGAPFTHLKEIPAIKRVLFFKTNVIVSVNIN